MKIIILIFFYFFLTNVQAQQIEFPKNIALSFTQVRYLKNTDIELKATGEIEIKNGETINWVQSKPFSYKMIITQNAIVKESQGKMVEIKNLGTERMLSLIFPILKGDLTAVQENFRVIKNKKSYTLIPKDEGLKKIIEKIIIKVNKYIQSFYLEEASGNHLKIHFKKK